MTRNEKSMPVEELRALDFLVGEFVSLQTLYSDAAARPVRYECIMRGVRESCDRYLRTEFFSDPPGLGIESAIYIHGYCKGRSRYELHGFLSSCDEPMRLAGGWSDGTLTLVSEPTTSADGLHRFRQRLTPRGEDRWEFLQERWELDGYAKHIEGTFVLCPISLQ